MSSQLDKRFPKFDHTVTPKTEREIYLTVQRIYDFIDQFKKELQVEIKRLASGQQLRLDELSNLVNGFGTRLIGLEAGQANPLEELGGGTITEIDTASGEITGGPITNTGTLGLANTAVAPGSYLNANITVDQKGRITNIASGGVGTPSDFFSAENKDAVQIKQGQIVATHTSGVGVNLANASNNTKNAIGLMTLATNVGVSNLVQTDGIFAMANWTDVIGSVTLAAKTVYYLDTTNGKLTAIPPSVVGQIVQRIGTSVSTTELWIEIEEAILL